MPGEDTSPKPVILQQILSFVLPVTALIIIPYLLEPDFTVWIDAQFLAGVVIIASGLLLLGVTISSIIRRGKGTLAPWSPARKLVVAGLYSRMRNPMITGVLVALLGESLSFHSSRIFIWTIGFFLINSIYFRLIEEPGLRKRFGTEYDEYAKNVPRWMPRMTPWNPEN